MTRNMAIAFKHSKSYVGNTRRIVGGPRKKAGLHVETGVFEDARQGHGRGVAALIRGADRSFLRACKNSSRKEFLYGDEVKM